MRCCYQLVMMMWDQDQDLVITEVLQYMDRRARSTSSIIVDYHIVQTVYLIDTLQLDNQIR